MNKPTNLTDALAALKTDNAAALEKQTRELTLKYQLLELTGLDFIVLEHGPDHTSAWIKNAPQFHRDKFESRKLAEYYKDLCTAFTPAPRPIGRGGKTYENFAPVRVGIANNTSGIVFSHPQQLRIAFTFTGGLTVQFNMPLAKSHMQDDVLVQNSFAKKRLPGQRNATTKNIYYLTGFGCIHFSGDTYTSYARSVEESADFMHVVLHGSWPE